MDCCRICGRLTGGAPLREPCGTHLASWERLDSRTPDLLIPMRRYRAAPHAPAPAPARRLVGGAMLAPALGFRPA